MLAYILGQFLYWIPTKTHRTISKNLQICLPELSTKEKTTLTKRIFLENARLAMEIPVAWLGSKNRVEDLLTQVNNGQLVADAFENKRPLIIAVPHIGNWEFFWHWLQLNYPTIGMYTPAKIQQIDQLMLLSRQRYGGRPYATDPKGIMGLLRALKTGSIMMILPDQAPRHGAGIYTDFFAKPAYTMTLLHRFIQKTDANLLFGSCLRNADGKGFQINISKPEFDIHLSDVKAFNEAMNLQIEAMVRQTPEQYQWGYKRFKRQADGSDWYNN